ncbi:MAG: hypothetical protein AAB257_02550 [Nitrospinota bacterium]
MFTIDDIIWVDAIVEKILWKHNVLTSEVEEVAGIYQYFLSRSLAIKH